jgi:hypothetical protein
MQIHAGEIGDHAAKMGGHAAKKALGFILKWFLASIIRFKMDDLPAPAKALARKDQTIAVIVTVAVMVPANDDLAFKVEKLGHLLSDVPGQGSNA